jgi:hypothetical protein
MDKVVEMFQRKHSVLLLAISIFYLILFFNSISGDASIYFSYADNFFDLPFSYSPGIVKYGATGPLYVFYLAIIKLLFGSVWIASAKIFNWLLILTGFWLLGKIVGKNKLIYLVYISALCTGLWLTSLELYETGLLFFFTSVVLYLMKDNKTLSIILFGLLPLIRPETILISICFQLYEYKQRKDLKYSISTSFVAYIPLLIYSLYMYNHTGTFIPTSIEGRAIFALENGDYIDRLVTTIKSLLRPSGLIYIVFAFSMFTLIKRVKDNIIYYIPILIFTTLYLLSPPSQYITRYLLVILPFIIILLTYLLHDIANSKSNVKYFQLSLLSFMFLFLGATIFIKQKLTRYDDNYNTVLLYDLNRVIDSIGIINSNVLIYEIQAQYNQQDIDYISADGIVGGEIFPFLKNEISFKEWLDYYDIEYIVTMNGYGYRKSLRSTELFELYQHDVENQIGSNIIIDKVELKKIFSNPIFTSSMNIDTVKYEGYGNVLFKLYEEENKSWVGHPPFWNSIYKIK